MASPWVERALSNTLPSKSLDTYDTKEYRTHMTYTQFRLMVEAAGGTVHHFQFDGGYTLDVKVENVRVRKTHEWGDRLTAEQQVLDALAEQGVFIGEDDPRVINEPVIEKGY